ncbi:hypothetical protein OsJ_11190 [Oryza sativa Japonica Group]|uniref:Uncharacterized protein n=1 Tax=Oryza sativa subsp. japonica TaxID=39947 RepID=A3AIW3_ORYSJ|nr:hypothetical protein OsJ_11190 [Oryza sativa Japonica Group]
MEPEGAAATARGRSAATTSSGPSGNDVEQLRWRGGRAATAPGSPSSGRRSSWRRNGGGAELRISGRVAAATPSSSRLSSSSVAAELTESDIGQRQRTRMARRFSSPSLFFTPSRLRLLRRHRRPTWSKFQTSSVL